MGSSPGTSKWEFPTSSRCEFLHSNCCMVFAPISCQKWLEKHTKPRFPRVLRGFSPARRRSTACNAPFKQKPNEGPNSPPLQATAGHPAVGCSARGKTQSETICARCARASEKIRIYAPPAHCGVCCCRCADCISRNAVGVCFNIKVGNAAVKLLPKKLKLPESAWSSQCRIQPR